MHVNLLLACKWLSAITGPPCRLLCSIRLGFAFVWVVVCVFVECNQLITAIRDDFVVLCLRLRIRVGVEVLSRWFDKTWS